MSLKCAENFVLLVWYCCRQNDKDQTEKGYYVDLFSFLAKGHSLHFEQKT